MEEIQGDSVRSEPGTPNATWWPLGFIGKLQAVSLLQKVEASTGRELSRDAAKAESLSQAASQTLWSAGTFSGPIPNGFYSIILVEALAVQLTQREGELLHEKAEVKKLANFLKQATEDARIVRQSSILIKGCLLFFSLGLSWKMTCRVLFRWALGRLRKLLFPLRASMELGNTLKSVVHLFFYLVALWIYWNSRHNSSNFSSSSSQVQEQQ